MQRISVPKILSAIAICFGGLSVVSTANAADCPIKLGGLAPLSAPGSVTGGEAMRDAMLLAERDINAAGGVLGCDVKVVIADTEGLPEKARALMELLEAATTVLWAWRVRTSQTIAVFQSFSLKPGTTRLRATSKNIYFELRRLAPGRQVLSGSLPHRPRA